MRLITLTTDFGYQDWFVGVMKGVILGRAPEARVVDITHGLPRGNVAAAALTLKSIRPHFPPDAVHVVVVDPGVGSSRAPLAIRCDKGYLVGPDNGVFELVLREAKRWTARKIERAAARLPELSATFHGRDVFAPTAAWLARGGAFHRLGPRVSELHPLPWPEAKQEGRDWVGEVIHLDVFGNALTNLPNACVGGDPPGSWEILLPGRKHALLREYYAAVPPGEPLVVRGSAGWLEIAINAGSAAERLGLTAGAPVRLKRVSPPGQARPRRG